MIAATIASEYSDIYDKVVNGNRIPVTESIKHFYDAYKALRIQYVDIEVAADSEFSAPEDPKNAITLISVKDSYIKNKYFFFTQRRDFKKEKKTIKYYHEETKKTYNLVVFFESNEKDMLETFFYFVKQTRPDMFTGWYFEDFDYPYIVNRSKLLELESVRSLSPELKVYSSKINKTKQKGKDFSRHDFRNTCGGVILFDMLWGYTRIQGSHSEGNGLHQTSLRHLKFGKKSVHIVEEDWYSAEKNEEKMSEGFFKFIYYGFVDVLLLEMLEAKCSIIFSFFYISRFTSVEWEKLHHASVAIDMAQMMYKEPELFLPSKIRVVDSSDDDLKGGQVESPPPGLVAGFEIVLDASRQYPNMIRSGNLGVETYIPPEQHSKFLGKDIARIANGEWFRKDKISFASKLVTNVFGLRDFVDGMLARYDSNDPMYDIWDKIKTVVKNFINTVFGSFANQHTRFYHKPTAKSITFLGRSLLEHNKKFTLRAAKFLRTKGINVNGKNVKCKIKKIYGDTDSIMIHVDTKDREVAKAVGKFLSKFLNKSFDSFCESQGMIREHLKLEFESIYLNLFFPAMEDQDRGTKKCYCAWNIYNGEKDKWIEPYKWKLSGLSAKKSNTPLFAKGIQEQLLKNICNGVGGQELKKYLIDVVDDCLSLMKRKACPKCKSTKTAKINLEKIKCKDCGLAFDKKEAQYDPDSLMKISIPYRFGKDAATYTGDKIASKIARSIATTSKMRIRKGNSFMYFWTRGEGKRSIFAFSPENPIIPSKVEIDKSAMVERLVQAKVDNIIPFFGIEWEDIYMPGGAARLDKFLSKQVK